MFSPLELISAGSWEEEDVEKSKMWEIETLKK